ncbi:YceI family protein [Tenacibaculum sp. UWU-22]|uniref:YceI family protein n=1 Tax=Tenacibaculum sp. UWU-22 TaxID=3234187 RepID=UPI0034DB5D6E
MRKIFFLISIVTLAFGACKTEKKEKIAAKEKVAIKEVTVPNNVDTTNSIITWKGTKPTGSHNGSVALKEGALVTKDGMVKGGDFVIDLTTIKCLDIEDEKYNQKLVNHLKSADFFDVEKYPTVKFVIASTEIKNNKLQVTGNLTIKNITKSITIPATISEDNGITTFASDIFTINRADFNVKYGSKSFFDNLKDKFIDDLIELSFTVKTKK